MKRKNNLFGLSAYSIAQAFIFLLFLILISTGCYNSRNYGIPKKQPITQGGKIFQTEFSPLMGNDMHKFINEVYTYEAIEKDKIEIKYEYTEQYMGKTVAKTEGISIPFDQNHEAILETKLVTPHKFKGQKLILKVVDEQNRITVQPFWIVAKITKREALDIAEKVCKAEDWSFEDVGIDESASLWSIMTHQSRLGGNANIDIDKETGDVVKKWYNGK